MEWVYVGVGGKCGAWKDGNGGLAAHNQRIKSNHGKFRVAGNKVVELPQSYDCVSVCVLTMCCTETTFLIAGMQQVVDCAAWFNGYNSTGCSGGSITDALDYMMKYNAVGAGGLCLLPTFYSNPAENRATMVMI